MHSFQLSVISFIVINLIIGCHSEQKEIDSDNYLSRLIADLWVEGADVIRIIWRDCSKKLVDVKDVIDHTEYFPKFVRCMKRKTLRALDRSLIPDVVPVADGINLVRFELVDKSGNVMPENETNFWTEKELEEGEWRILALQRMAKVFRTHVIKFDLEGGKNVEKVEYRGRRRHHMMTMMMFGVVSIGMVIIPMGFQFLAVLGGKALLLAKMALILASIQGLKRVAANPVNYGLYHSYPYDYYEKRSREDWPPSGVLPATPPPSLPEHNPWNDNEAVKLDRLQLIPNKKDRKDNKNAEVVTWKPEKPKSVKKQAEPRFYPVYSGVSDEPAPTFTAIDAPSPLIDFTTTPGDVQADYAIDLPFNRLHFQSPSTVIST